MAVNRIPDGYHTITPYLIVEGGARALDFYKQAFGAEETVRMAGPDGKVGHAEMRLGDSMFMLADENSGMGSRSPKALGGSPITMMIYVEDVDKVFARAIAAGAREQRPVVNQFYGDRSGSVVDPFGHVWHIATHIEDVSPEEMKRRMAAMKPG